MTGFEMRVRRELDAIHAEKSVIEDELEHEKVAFAESVSAFVGQEAKRMSGQPNLAIKKSLWCRVKNWATKKFASTFQQG